MSVASPQRPLDEAPREAEQTELHPELNRAHVRFIGVGKTYDGHHGPVNALQGIDLAIQRGEVFGIIGRSGAGKSSLIRTINRLEQPTSGRVLIDQVDIGQFDEDRLVELRRRIGMIFQHFNLDLPALQPDVGQDRLAERRAAAEGRRGAQACARAEGPRAARTGGPEGQAQGL